MSFLQKIKNNPSLFLAFSICATWAGAGSLIVGMQMVQQHGVIPFFLWALGNTLCCVFFGLVAGKMPLVRKIFLSKPFKIVVGLMCIFQLWVNMSAINDALSIINPLFGTITTYIISIGFLILYLKFALIKNIATDDIGWKIVYVLIVFLTIVSFVINGFELPSLGATKEGITLGIQRFFTLMVGPFFYPYFWELYKKNEDENNEFKKVNMTKCFAIGGLLFGIYICFVFMLGMTSFSPAMNIIKAVLLALIALSSLTSFIYSIYISFGNKIGFAINTFGIAGWYFLIPMGVMGIWSAMQDIRFVIVIAVIVGALIYNLIQKRKGNNVKKQKA